MTTIPNQKVATILRIIHVYIYIYMYTCSIVIIVPIPKPYGRFLQFEISKSPWFSIPSHGLITWMDWGTTILGNVHIVTRQRKGFHSKGQPQKLSIMWLGNSIRSSNWLLSWGRWKFSISAYVVVWKSEN